jgi:nucleoside transporter
MAGSAPNPYDSSKVSDDHSPDLGGPAPPTKPMGGKFQLCMMMFLQYIIWGAWLPLANSYLGGGLGFDGNQKGWIQATFPMAALVTIIIGGQLADRYFAAQRVLGVCHLLGGLCILAVPFARDFWSVFGLMLGHCVFYGPTMALTNSIAFKNIASAKDDFGFIRLWGTIGWIAASVPMAILLNDGYREYFFKLEPVRPKDLAVIFQVAGIAALALAAYSLFLPHTPPTPGSGEKSSIGAALGLLGKPVILILFIATFMDTVVHTGYFFFTGEFLEHLGVSKGWIMPAMSVGQVAEIGTMAVLGMFLKRLGWKTTMTLGILGHAIRFGIFWLAASQGKTLLPLVIAINVMHGVCYAFFFAVVFIFIDEYFPKEIRHTAQALFNVAVLGVGQLIGNAVCGYIATTNSVKVDGKDVAQYPGIFLTLSGLALATAVFFALTFHPGKTGSESRDG